MKRLFSPYLYFYSTIVAMGMVAPENATAKMVKQPKAPPPPFVEHLAPQKTLELDHLGGLQVSLGKPQAPLKVVMYYSLTCPHCHEFQKDELPKIQKEFIDKGLVQFIFRDFPTDWFAIKAAKIAWCHGREQYRPFAQKLLETQAKWLPAYTGPDKEKQEKAIKEAEQALEAIARELGISHEDYQKCTAPDTETEKTILRTSFEAQKSHQINAAPAFLVNGKVYNKGILNPEAIHALLLDMGIHGELGGG